MWPEGWGRAVLCWQIYWLIMNPWSLIFLLWHPQSDFILRIVYSSSRNGCCSPKQLILIQKLLKTGEEITFSMCPLVRTRSCFLEYSHLSFPCASLARIVSWLTARASLVAQRVKRLPAMRETGVWFLGQEGPPEKEMATHSRILAWQISWTEVPGRL